MIVLAILATVAAFVWSIVVVFANGMSDGPVAFQGGGTVLAAWIGAAVMWLAWWIG